MISSTNLGVVLAQGTPKTTGRPNSQQSTQQTNGQKSPSSGGSQPQRQASGGQQAETAEPAPLDPELIAVLREWEQKSSQIRSIKGKHTRYVYNHVFETEKRAEGKFYIEMPDKGRIDLIGVDLKKLKKEDKESKRIGKSGNPFRVESDRSQKWICNGDEVLMVNDEEKSFSIIPLSDEMRGENMIDTELPFLFGMKAADAVKRYQLALLQSKEPNQHAILVTPRFDKDKRNYKVAKITLDKKYFLPRTVAMQAPTGGEETHYVFDIQDVNGRNPLVKVSDFFTDKDPYHPDLKKAGYKLAVTNDLANQNENAPPSGRSNANPVRQTSGTNTNGSGAGSVQLGPNGSSRPSGSGVIPAGGQQSSRSSSNSSNLNGRSPK